MMTRKYVKSSSWIRRCQNRHNVRENHILYCVSSVGNAQRPSDYSVLIWALSIPLITRVLLNTWSWNRTIRHHPDWFSATLNARSSALLAVQWSVPFWILSSFLPPYPPVSPFAWRFAIESPRQRPWLAPSKTVWVYSNLFASQSGFGLG